MRRMLHTDGYIFDISISAEYILAYIYEERDVGMWLVDTWND